MRKIADFIQIQRS